CIPTRRSSDLSSSSRSRYHPRTARAAGVPGDASSRCRRRARGDGRVRPAVPGRGAAVPGCRLRRRPDAGTPARPGGRALADRRRRPDPRPPRSAARRRLRLRGLRVRQVRRDHPRLLRGAHPMTATATKPRKPKNKPAPKRTVLEARPPMPSYESLVEETGINPDTALAEYDRLREDAGWRPWSLRGAWEVITGRSDWTAWTLGDARALREIGRAHV